MGPERTQSSNSTGTQTGRPFEYFHGNADAVDANTPCAFLPTVEDRFTCVENKIFGLISKDRQNPPAPSLSTFDILSSLAVSELHNDYPSGKEQCLRNEVLSRPDRSVGLEEMFEMAYAGCCAREFHCALLTTYNVLEEGARRFRREGLPVSQKLRPMRSGDNLGVSYHFFGAAYFTAVAGNFLSWSTLRIHQYARNTLGTTTDAVSVADLPTFDPFLSDPEKGEIDMIGHNLGTRLNGLFKTPWRAPYFFARIVEIQM